MELRAGKFCERGMRSGHGLALPTGAVAKVCVFGENSIVPADVGPSFLEQGDQNRAMAARLIGVAAAKGEVGVPQEGRKQIEGPDAAPVLRHVLRHWRALRRPACGVNARAVAR